MTCEQWDVVTALFPFTEQALRKPRPVLVISSDEFNQGHQHIIGAMITTGAGSTWPSDIVIEDLSAAGLSHRSLIRWKLFTLPLAMIGKRIGKLSEQERIASAKTAASIMPIKST